MFWDCMFTNTLSAISKLAEPSKIGKWLCRVRLANAVIGLAAAPAYSFINQATLDNLS